MERKLCASCHRIYTENHRCLLCQSSKYGPLAKAYEFRSIHYRLAYHAFNLLSETLEQDFTQTYKLAVELGVSVEQLHQALEELYTFNADPDNDETE